MHSFTFEIKGKDNSEIIWPLSHVPAVEDSQFFELNIALDLQAQLEMIRIKSMWYFFSHYKTMQKICIYSDFQMHSIPL